MTNKESNIILLLMIQVRDICLSFGSQKIFDHLSFIINHHDKIGLVGRNGSGKTTLLKAIIEPSLLDSGAISIQNKKKIAYMPQEVVLQSPRTILDEVSTAFAELNSLQQELQKLESEILINGHHALERYAQVQEAITALDPEACKARAKKMLMDLGFSTTQFDTPVESLSVGWKMRIVLAKLLLQDADFYLFDEPTNHLDLMTKEWFLEFLQKADFGFMLICHERYFLDELCDKIIELERGKATWYIGNYSDYLVQKEHHQALLESAYVQQQKELKHKQAIIEKFRAGTRARMAQSMEKSLAKIDRIELPQTIKNVSFSFPPVVQAGKVVLKVENLAQKFDHKTIFEKVSFQIERGQKVALIAPNGVGKTTLFHIIAGKLPVQQGSITFGHNVSYAVFAQDQNKVLNPDKTIFDNVKELCPAITEQKIRTMLGSFLLSNEDVYKKVSVLSGGEKNRVGMVSVLLQQVNLLMLDEPTNHLDIPSKEVLLKALQAFQGTLIFVSHDRDFINDLATDIIELTPSGAHLYHGNYDAYVYYKQQVASEFASNTSQAKVSRESSTNQSAQAESYDTQKQMKRLEEKIAKLEKQIRAVELSFAELAYGSKNFQDAQEKLALFKKQLQEVEGEWEKLVA